MTRTRSRSALVGMAACVLLSACATTLSGHGATSISSSSSTDFPSPSSTTTTSQPSAAPTSASALRRLLLPIPDDGQSWGTAWSRNETPTVSEWVAHVYPASSRDLIVGELRDDGIQAVAHRAWIVADGDQADIVLLGFASASGARDRYLAATRAKSEQPGVKPFAIPGTNAVGYAHTTLDSLGNIPAIIYAQRGKLDLEVFYYSPDKLRTADAVLWTTQQLGQLP